jgi:hypothetical protein
MSRTNPNKKAKRKAKKTILFYGEGSTEEVFLKHLRKNYSRNSGVAVTIKNGQGGTADRIIKRAISCNPAGFDKKIAWLDNDKSKKEMEKARKLAMDFEILLIENQPCLEAFLLGILNNGKVQQNQSSVFYKKLFEKEYICKKKRCNSEEYDKIFSKKVFNSARKKVKELDLIIRIMEGE